MLILTQANLMKANVFPATIPSFSQHVQNDVYDIIEETVEVDKDDTIWVINEDQVESISNEVPEAQNEDENRDHEEHTEDETISNLINPTEHANVEENWAPRNDTNLTPMTFFSQTQQSQNLLTLSDVQNSPYISLLPRIPVDKMNDELILKKNK